MKLIQCLVLLLVMMFLPGCASTPNGYFIDRKHDALDVFSIGVEKGGLGITAQAGPFMTGLGGGNGEGFGIMGGQAGKYSMMDVEFLLLGYKDLWIDTDLEYLRHKSYNSAQVIFLINSFGLLGSSGHVYAHEVGHIELFVSLGYGVRMGFNIFELFDFCLGWIKIDPLIDDYKAKEEMANHGLESTGAPPAAGTLETHP